MDKGTRANTVRPYGTIQYQAIVRVWSKDERRLDERDERRFVARRLDVRRFEAQRVTCVNANNGDGSTNGTEPVGAI